MTLPGNPCWLSRKEILARAVIGMPAAHPELITRQPGRAEWKHLARWLAEMWPHDEYTAILRKDWRQDQP